MNSDVKLKKAFWTAVLVLLMVVSFFFLSAGATNVLQKLPTIPSLDVKADTVLKLTASATLASVAVSAVPGDMGTPIAEKLADFTEYLMLILCVLYSEKYLVTILGGAVFKVLVPAVCLLLITALYWNGKALKKLALKLAVFALALLVLIPVSIGVSDLIYRAYQTSIDVTISSAQDLSGDVNGQPDTGSAAGSSGVLSGSLTERAKELVRRGADVLKRFVESLAVMIVISCVIPVLSLLFFLWLIKRLTGVDILSRVSDQRRNQP